MAKYKLIGKRMVHCYASSTLQALSDTQTVANTINDNIYTCEWKIVDVINSVNLDYNNLDENVLDIDSLDAAIFCAEHFGGSHRMFGQGAVYRYTFPDDKIKNGYVVDARNNKITLTNLKCDVYSDKRNTAGVRLSCSHGTSSYPKQTKSEIQDGDNSFHINSQYPRIMTTDVPDPVKLSENHGTSTISSTGDDFYLQKYLFLYVHLQEYNNSEMIRNNEMAGSGRIDNCIEVDLGAAVPGWEEDKVYDLSTDEGGSIMGTSAFYICKNGVLAEKKKGDVRGDRSMMIRQDGNPISSTAEVIDTSGEQSSVGLNAVYQQFLAGSGDVPVAEGGEKQNGAKFTIWKTTMQVPGTDLEEEDEIAIWKLDSCVLCIPFVKPTAFNGKYIKLEFDNLDMSSGAMFNVFLKSSWAESLTNEEITSAWLYDGESTKDGFFKLGEIKTGTSAIFELPSFAERSGTFVISGYMPPEYVSLTSTNKQGTGDVGFLPTVLITN